MTDSNVATFPFDKQIVKVKKATSLKLTWVAKTDTAAATAAEDW